MLLPLNPAHHQFVIFYSVVQAARYSFERSEKEIVMVKVDGLVFSDWDIDLLSLWFIEKSTEQTQSSMHPFSCQPQTIIVVQGDTVLSLGLFFFWAVSQEAGDCCQINIRWKTS